MYTKQQKLWQSVSEGLTIPSFRLGPDPSQSNPLSHFLYEDFIAGKLPNKQTQATPHL